MFSKDNQPINSSETLKVLAQFSQQSKANQQKGDYVKAKQCYQNMKKILKDLYQESKNQQTKQVITQKIKKFQLQIERLQLLQSNQIKSFERKLNPYYLPKKYQNKTINNQQIQSPNNIKKNISLHEKIKEVRPNLEKEKSGSKTNQNFSKPINCTKKNLKQQQQPKQINSCRSDKKLQQFPKQLNNCLSSKKIPLKGNQKLQQQQQKNNLQHMIPLQKKQQSSSNEINKLYINKVQKKKQPQPKKVLPSKNQKVVVKNNISNQKLASEKKKPIDPDIQDLIVTNTKISFKNIVGMKDLIKKLDQAVLKPRLRPDLYKGIRAPPRGLLFYGPPGNGKTYVAKALATESKCTFFSVSASAIMSKWIGQAQQKLQKLFKVAQTMSPSIIFIDQIDSLLTARSEKQNEVSRRVKTQFLVWMDGMMSAKDGALLLIGATNLPSQLDKAALRRFNELIYVGMPDNETRCGLVLSNLKDISYQFNQKDMQKLSQLLNGYSASEIKDIVKQVANLPLYQITQSKFHFIQQENLRPVILKDFEKVLTKRKPLLSEQDLKKYQGDFK